VEGPVGAKPARSKPAHLMCGSRLWTIAAFVCSAYFAKIAVERVRAADIGWSHDALDVTTHAVWVLFMLGLITETRCWKERMFFSLVLANFALASVMGLWISAPLALINQTRMLSAALWVGAGVVSFALIFARGSKQ
jgi:hypothetical protein